MAAAQPQMSRIEPAGPASAYKTYRMLSPASHRRTATCEEVECVNWQNGWKTCLDVSNPKHAEAANWIRLHAGRSFTVEETGTAVTFRFPPGQSCFKPHTIPFKPHLLLVQGGDWRGNPRGVPTVRHTSMNNWVEDFALNQQAIRDRIERA